MRRSHAAVVLLCLGLLNTPGLTNAKGYVGCLFSKSLCQAEVEWCFDDYAFGKCLSADGKDGEVDLYRYDLKRESLHLLQREMERLINSGYRWSHTYTQCVLQAALYSLRYQIDFDVDKCSRLSDEDLLAALKALEGNVEELDPRHLAHVKFTPSILDPHAEYADEIYVPLSEREEAIENVVFPSDVIKAVDGPSYPDEIARELYLQQLDKPKRSELFGNYQPQEYEPPLNDRYDSGFLEVLKDLSNDEDGYDKYSISDSEEPKFHFNEKYNTPDQFRLGFESRDYQDEDKFPFEDQQPLKIERNPTGFSRTYNTPDNFRNGIETKDIIEYAERNNPVLYLNAPNSYLSPEDRELIYENFQNDENLPENPRSSDVEGHFTEGGVVYLKGEEPNEQNLEDSFEELTPLGWGFKRPERLDVKKPGPAFSTNNYAFKDEKEESGKPAENSAKDAKPTAKAPEVKQEAKPADIPKPEKKKVGSPIDSRSKTSTTTENPQLKADRVDRDFVYIKISELIIDYARIKNIVEKVRKILNLPFALTHETYENGVISFKVEPGNKSRINATQVAHLILEKKEPIETAIGDEIFEVGVGKKHKEAVHLPGEVSARTFLGIDNNEREMWILSFLLCGVIAAVAIAGAALFVIKRHSRTRDKLQNLTQPDTEASKDYQDLCRARMATKTAQEKPEGGVVGHRITNLTRESEGSNHSPSSRSSTSSWSEEPALTNMDISTGHMVLSYMEDHLKNKDRLEQEWVALCAYEAEPCATTIAVKGENSKKNRYNDVLPYDHARVVLNELSNISGSDYINASTITDHDPRNPAYIATQGPLPHTAADFWQMVWEQGSVVMVMLTRLTENGTAMCHRYWPEEGSELYHIYEVHLVSEHIWCDDYLVRSFYLKNLKTGETRTVTQFHFLSWPENGVPLSTKALLEFRRKVNKSYRGRSCPIVVHCSDGVGRTGTYCLIDMVLNRMAKGAKEIDIAATLEHIRDQRPLMVRTKQQFEFVLMAVAEEVHAILKALPANHSPPPVLKEKE